MLVDGATHDEYSLSGDSWSANAPNPRPVGRTNLNSNAVLGDNVYFFGGRNLNNATNAQSVDIYNATGDTWTLDVVIDDGRVHYATWGLGRTSLRHFAGRRSLAEAAKVRIEHGTITMPAVWNAPLASVAPTSRTECTWSASA